MAEQAEQAEREDGETGAEKASEGSGECRLPEIKMVSITYGRKLNLENYNSAHVEISAWADLDPEEDDADEAVEALWGWAKLQVKMQLQPLVEWKARKEEAAKAVIAERQNGNGAPAAGPLQGRALLEAKAKAAGQAPPPAAGGSSAQVQDRAPAQQAVKRGTAELQSIEVDAKGAIAFHVKGFKWPFKDARGTAVVIELFDQALGWTEEHLVPGALYEGSAIEGLMLDWEKPDKYYDVVRVYLP